MTLYSEQSTVFPSGFPSLVWISDESWDGNKHWVSWKNHSSIFVFILLLVHSSISFGAQNLKTFTAFPGVAGCTPEVGGIVVGCRGQPHRRSSLRQFWLALQGAETIRGDEATPGHPAYTRSIRPLVTRWWQSRILSLPTCLLLLTLVSCFHL